MEQPRAYYKAVLNKAMTYLKKYQKLDVIDCDAPSRKSTALVNLEKRVGNFIKKYEQN